MLKKSIILMSILYSSLNASAVDSRFSYQDYLDFGANKGKFKAGTTGLSVSSKDGTLKVDSFSSMPMIDFSASNKTGRLKGEFTNIGANNVITAAHMIQSATSNPKALRKYQNLQFGGVNTIVVQTSNNFKEWVDNIDNGKTKDFITMRMSKVNLNKKADVINIDLYDKNGNDIHFNKANNFISTCANPNETEDNCTKWTSFIDSKEYKENKGELFPNVTTDQDGNVIRTPNPRYTMFVRSGTGLQKVVSLKPNGINTTSTMISEAGHYFTGGIVYINPNEYRINNAIISTNNENKRMLDFSSSVARGDSGSALYVWDNTDKKWYIVGVGSTSDCESDKDIGCSFGNYHMVDKQIISNFIDEHSIMINNDLLLDSNLKQKTNIGTFETLKDAKNQEIAFTLGNNSFKHHFGTTSGVSEAEYKSRLDAMVNDKDLFITGGKSLELKNNSDIGSSALIFSDNLGEYTISGDFDFLHGGLDIGANSVVNYYAKTAEFDFLHKIGAGKLIVNSSSPKAGLRIGGGEVEFKNSSGTTFGSIYMTNNSSLKINNANQINTDYLYFGNNAGKLDLNGNNINLNNFYASDNNAVITSTIASEISINKTNLTNNTISHGNITGNIKIVQNNNSSDKYSVYDGGLDIQNMEFKNGNLVLQGHPVVHEYVKGYVGKTAEQVAASIKSAGGGDVYTTPTRLDQEDWEERNYKMASLTLDKASLDILKHSNVDIKNINSISSTIKIGDNLAYIDRFDGENIKANDTIGSDTNESYYNNLKYQEEVTKGKSIAKNIKINSNFDLKTNSKLSLLNGTDFKGKITADDSSSLEFNGAMINANINASSLNSTNTTYIYESKTNALNISKSTSGAKNTLLIQKDFLNGDDKILLASLSNSTLVAENYFGIKGEDSVFADLKANVKYYAENGTAKWYLEKIPSTPSPEPSPTPNEPSTPNKPSEPDTKPTPPTNTDTTPSEPINPNEPSVNNPSEPSIPSTPTTPSEPDTKPVEPKPDTPTTPSEPTIPDEPSTPNNPEEPVIVELDPNPSNNPSNVETKGHYQEYFFVREKESSINTAKNTLNQAFFNYVLEWNNMQKRMGELRDEVANGGIWIRNFGGASSYLKDNKTKYYELQIGADKISEMDDFNAYAGIIFTNSIYKLDTKNMLEGKVKGIGGGLYSSFIFNNGFYIDMIAKYVDYKNDYTLTLNNGNNKAIYINANNHSKSVVASVELGNRFYMNNYYLEPSVELISGYVSAISLENKAEHIKLESKSFVPFNTKTMLSFGKQSSEDSRFGFRFGVGIAADLAKNGDKTIRDLNVIRQIEGKKDTRMLTNASFNYNFTNNLRLMTEFERTFFGDLNVDYSLNMTLRKSF
ncbi:autotransporter outer membrane beta-barrel domain-containing protein [Campylobacter sp. RM9332]|uniref:autotransporter outer membrane beta-barrel domain-containing protein n=3 Tax=unclassified Campylobacter TaxID=2593542 RepID=UPI00301442A7|nr:autotransporter outer membrane beta-barrel domain-containing protein [Campylobacter sp. RM9332]